MNIRIGRFQWDGDNVVLVSHNGDKWPLEWVTMQAGAWGWGEDGVAKLPRPWRFDPATSRPIVRGDNVVVEFINGNPKRVLVRAGVVAIDRHAFLAASYADEGAEQLKVRMAPRDPTTGAVRGVVQVSTAPADGTVLVQLLGADEETVRAEVRLGVDSVEIRGGQIILGTPTSATEAEPLIKGRTYLDDEADAATQEALVLAAAGGFFGIPFDKITARAAKLALAKAAPDGRPYLSTISETE